MGIDEVVASFGVDTLKKQFSYRMPSVFHEFVSLSERIILRDEIGFVGISANGEECWAFLTSGPINKFAIEQGCVHDNTIDDGRFEFVVPS